MGAIVLWGNWKQGSSPSIANGQITGYTAREFQSGVNPITEITVRTAEVTTAQIERLRNGALSKMVKIEFMGATR